MTARDECRSLDPAAVVFVIERGDVLDFHSPEAAAGHMEAIDVENGEYTAVYGLDGTVYDLTLEDGQARLRRTERREPESLQRALRAYHDEPPDSVVIYDPYALINERQLWAWQRRWPRWPRWLTERLHGTAPVLLEGPPTRRSG